MENLGQFRPEVNSPRWFDLSDLPNEVWHDIQEYEGVYQVSCYGRIKSLPRTKRGGSFVHPAKIIKLCLGKAPKNNYYIVVLHKDGAKSTKRVCRLVADAGLGRKAYGFEIKKPYYMDACNAIKTNVQLDLFNAERKYYQKEVDYEQMEEIRG